MYYNHFKFKKTQAMNHFRLFIIVLLANVVFSYGKSSYPPINLHPENPHYLLFRGKPSILIGSTEHYGAVMNLDFDYIKYFDELVASGLNVTRTFTGVYVEYKEAFGIKKNTLAPEQERYICPWARSKVPGYANGGNKFDLDKWDKNYFKRLKDFVAEAGKRNIVVELVLFSNFYDALQWKISPLYIANNINNIGNTLNHNEILALTHPEILEVMEKMTRKIIAELKNFDNLYYEICNEPYFGDTAALKLWQKQMTDVVIDAEKKFKNKHLISQNVANKHSLVENPHPGVSIFNFHYATPPKAVSLNYHLNKVIGDNETGFKGIEDATYRCEAWDFILAGGGIFNHLDYSFTTGNEDGTFIISKDMPGGGGKTLRNQFRILADFMKSLDYINMMPDISSIRILKPENSTVQALVKKNETYAIYINSPANKSDTTISEIEVDLPHGSYELIWLDTKSGAQVTSKLEQHLGGKVRFISPAYSSDIALKINALK